jgi:hypothetical protein
MVRDQRTGERLLPRFQALAWGFVELGGYVKLFRPG